MTLIQHVDPEIGTLTHEGEEYEPQPGGVFEVPHEIALKLTAFKHLFRMFDGEAWPHPKSAEELEAERLSSLVEKVVEGRKPKAASKAKAKVEAAPEVSAEATEPEAAGQQGASEEENPDGGAADGAGTTPSQSEEPAAERKAAKAAPAKRARKPKAAAKTE